jgi:uncharacterized protein YjbJ (UPF0337 family)
MTDQRADGLVNEMEGKAQTASGKIAGDAKMLFDGRLKQAKGQAQQAYGRVIDGLDRLVEKAPPEVQGHARNGLDFARRKPLLTTGIVAGVAILLSGAGRRGR